MLCVSLLYALCKPTYLRVSYRSTLLRIIYMAYAYRTHIMYFVQLIYYTALYILYAYYKLYTILHNTHNNRRGRIIGRGPEDLPAVRRGHIRAGGGVC